MSAEFRPRYTSTISKYISVPNNLQKELRNICDSVKTVEVGKSSDLYRVISELIKASKSPVFSRATGWDSSIMLSDARFKRFPEMIDVELLFNVFLVTYQFVQLFRLVAADDKHQAIDQVTVTPEKLIQFMSDFPEELSNIPGDTVFRVQAKLRTLLGEINNSKKKHRGLFASEFIDFCNIPSLFSKESLGDAEVTHIEHMIYEDKKASIRARHQKLRTKTLHLLSWAKHHFSSKSTHLSNKLYRAKKVLKIVNEEYSDINDVRLMYVNRHDDSKKKLQVICQSIDACNVVINSQIEKRNKKEDEIHGYIMDLIKRQSMELEDLATEFNSADSSYTFSFRSDEKDKLWTNVFLGEAVEESRSKSLRIKEIKIEEMKKFQKDSIEFMDSITPTRNANEKNENNTDKKLKHEKSKASSKSTVRNKNNGVDSKDNNEENVLYSKCVRLKHLEKISSVMNEKRVWLKNQIVKLSEMHKVDMINKNHVMPLDHVTYKREISSKSKSFEWDNISDLVQVLSREEINKTTNKLGPLEVGNPKDKTKHVSKRLIRGHMKQEMVRKLTKAQDDAKAIAHETESKLFDTRINSLQKEKSDTFVEMKRRFFVEVEKIKRTEQKRLEDKLTFIQKETDHLKQMNNLKNKEKQNIILEMKKTTKQLKQVQDQNQKNIRIHELKKLRSNFYSRWQSGEFTLRQAVLQLLSIQSASVGSEKMLNLLRKQVTLLQQRKS